MPKDAGSNLLRSSRCLSHGRMGCMCSSPPTCPALGREKRSRSEAVSMRQVEADAHTWRPPDGGGPHPQAPEHRVLSAPHTGGPLGSSTTSQLQTHPPARSSQQLCAGLTMSGLPSTQVAERGTEKPRVAPAVAPTENLTECWVLPEKPIMEHPLN